MKTWRFKMAHAVAAASASLAMLAVPAQPAQAGTNTLAIFANTIAAYPSCMDFELKGMCFFLRCSLRGCYIRSSLKVSHYVPDAIFSTYSEVTAHPWEDIGRMVALPSTALGSWTMNSPWTDSSASNISEATQFTHFISADVYGNPAGLIGLILTGQLSEIVATFDVPGTENLLGFVEHELPRIPGMWAAVPKELLDSVMGEIYETVRKPMELIDKIKAVPSLLQNGKTALGLVNGLTPEKILKLVGIDIGPLMDAWRMIQMIAGGGGPLVSVGPDTLCPGSASALTLHYQSELDNLFWRGILPVEMLYPGSWLPLAQHDVGSWGARFPRTGELVHQDPVRASAVMAERAHSIIRSQNQPHVYTELKRNGNYRYFTEMEDSKRKWQRLYPDAESSCQTFGATMKSYSASERSIEDGYVWNVWNHYTCCLRRGSYLFSVP